MIVFASHNSLAQSIPPLNELVKRIEMVSLPNKPYTVSVSQAIEYSRRVKTQSVSPKAVSGVSTFGYIYDPKAGLRVGVNSNPKRASKTLQSTSNMQQPTLKVAVDLAKLFRNYSDWQNVRIISTYLNSDHCYEITAQDKSFSYVIWVDATRYYVPEVVLNIKGKRFAEIDITNRNVSGVYWLPSQIVLNNAIDGSKVTLNMGQYIF